MAEGGAGATPLGGGSRGAGGGLVDGLRPERDRGGGIRTAGPLGATLQSLAADAAAAALDGLELQGTVCPALVLAAGEAGWAGVFSVKRWLAVGGLSGGGLVPG